MLRHTSSSSPGKAGWWLLLHLWMPALVLAVVIVTCLSPVMAASPPGIPPGLPPAAKGNPKLSSSLNAMVGAAGPVPQVMTRSQTMATPGGETVRVIIESQPGQAGDVEVLARGIGTFEGSYENSVQATVPITVLTGLANSPSVRFVREPMVPKTLDSVGEGVATVNATAWQTASINGTGVSIGILDVGFKNYTDLQGAGELPANITYNWAVSQGSTEGTDVHGTACAEIVYDMAPGATFYLANFGTKVEFAEQAAWLVSQGVKVISCSVGWPAGGPLDGTGDFDNVVAAARAAGVLWVQSAGNDAQLHWAGPFVDSNSNEWLEFAPSDEMNDVTASGSNITLALTWDDPWQGSTNNYDLYLFDPATTPVTIVATSTNTQNGTTDPYEFINYHGTNGKVYGIGIGAINSPARVNFHLYSFNQLLQWKTPESSIIVPADSPDALTAGAVYWNNPTVLESFSSQGPTTDNRTKPDLVAPDGVTSQAYGHAFYGTSASAPYTAGAAALVAQRFPTYSAAQVQSFLEGRAVDLGTAGKDNMFGSGRLNLLDPLNFLLAMSITGSGTTDPFAGQNFYANGTLVPLTANATANWVFSSWSGNTTTVDNPALTSTNISIDHDYAITANFLRTQGTLTITTSGNGTVTGAGTYTANTTANITATPDAGWRFAGWTGGGASIGNASANETTILMDNDYALTATFDRPVLTVSANGSGTTTPTPGQYVYDFNSVVPVSANASTNWRFDHWTGAVANPGLATTNVTMSTDQSITAHFVRTHGTLTITTSGNGTATGAGTYTVNTAANITATPASGWQFTSWSGNITTVGNTAAASTTITMNGDYTLTAHFKPVLTIGVNGSGTTTPAPGSYPYDLNSVIPVSANASTNWMFDHWTGAVSGNTTASTNVTMTGGQTVSAYFTRTAGTLTLNTTGSGNVTGAGTYTVNTTANITATPAAGWQFTGWSGNVTTVGNAGAASTNVTISDDYTITANFQAIPAPPPSGGGGGGGAPGMISLVGRTDAGGYVLRDTKAFTADSQAYLLLPEGTRVLLRGFAPYTIFVFPLAAGAQPPPPPDTMVYGAEVYSFGPDGVQFDPPIIVHFKFKTELLPEGVGVNDLSIAWWDAESETWQLLPTTYDEETGYLLAEISHFTEYSVLAALPRPDISVTGMTPQSSDVTSGNDVVLNVQVTNAGNAAGDYQLTLLQDGSAVADRALSVDAGATVSEAFTVTGLATGEYTFAAEHITTTVTVSPEPMPATFEVRGLTVSPSKLDPGQSATITATVENTGDLSGSLDLNLMVNGDPLTTLPVQLEGGATGNFTVSWTFETPGLKIIGLGGKLAVVNVSGGEATSTPVPQPATPTPTVSPTPTETTTTPAGTETVTPTPTPTETPPPGMPGTWQIIVIAGGLIVLAAVMAYVFARRKRSPGDGEPPADS